MVKMIPPTNRLLKQHRVFKPIMCKTTPIMSEIHTVNFFNDHDKKCLCCNFYNENNELVERPLKMKKLYKVKVIHITYKNQMYALMSENK